MHGTIVQARSCDGLPRHQSWRRRVATILLATTWCAMGTIAATPTEAEIDAAVLGIARHELGTSRESLAVLDGMIHKTHGERALRAYLEGRLALVLRSDATNAAKREVCRRLESMGSSISHAALETLLYDEATVEMACFAFSGQFAVEVARALHDAMEKVSHPKTVVPIIQAVGERRDAASTEGLIRLARSEDASISRAAIASLGKVASPEARKFLQATIATETPSTATLACHAYLRAAGELPARGRTAEAVAIYAELETTSSAPRGVRRGARLRRQELTKNELSIDFDSLPAVSLFDGRSFSGWEGNLDSFRIEDRAIVAGTLKAKIPRNEFLATTQEYGDFELRLKTKLVGKGDNAGIQIRSRRVPNHHEVRGYQADTGTGVWGCLYDESRRHRMLAVADAGELAKVLKPGDWNDYVIRCIGKRIQLWINGHQTIDYVEPLDSIPQRGIIALQIHGGRPSEASYKDIVIREIP